MTPEQLDALPPLLLSNAAGVRVTITPVGAAIQRFVVPVSGKELDIVLGWNRPSTYATIEDTPYFGAIVGRVANRIAKGAFSVDGQAHQLATNNGPNALHGGPHGFHRRVFTPGPVESTPQGSAVELSYTSADGEEGYPGTLTVRVRYELAADAPELRTNITATTDKATPVNIAQHSYFNLAGHASGPILDHLVQLAASHYTPVDATQIPTGEVAPVAGGPFDFHAAPRRIGDAIDQVPGGYDHNFVLFGRGADAAQHTVNHKAADTPQLAATVTEPGSGLQLQVLTTAPGLQFYVGGFLGGPQPDAKDGAAYPRFGGLCLETQAFPNAVNQRGFPSVLLRPGETYCHEVVYRLALPS